MEGTVKLKTLAEIAAILATLVAILAYMKIEPNIIHDMPEIYQKAVEDDIEAVELNISKEDYSDSIELYNIYKAAIAINSDHTKDQKLMSVVDISLRNNDLKLAIAAAKEIESEHSRSITLHRIVKDSLKSPGVSGYAVIAAELIPSDHTKDLALREIIDFYESRAMGKSNYGALADLKKYKSIYEFADSPTYMGMWGEDAKQFADKWLKNRTYEEFLLFKEVFIFADSPTYMSMNEEEAKVFAEMWINKYSSEDFDLFNEAFQFADSPSGMSMSTKEAEKFAFKKLYAHRQSIEETLKPIQPPLKNGPTDK